VWRAALFLLMLTVCAAARGQQSCPWLTQGTAAALLGGAVRANAQVAEGVGSCEFVREDGSLRLKIVVSHARPKECVNGTALTGVGEDAVACTEEIAGEHRETIRGRVRAHYFLLTMSARSGSLSMRDALEQVGEEVAGNLF
jgi:hypothetical protein